MFRPLKVFDPELPLLYISMPLNKWLLRSLNSMNMWYGFLELFLSISFPPLGEEDTEGFSFEHSLEDKFVHSRCEAVLDVVCETREGFFIHDVMGVRSQTYHKMMLIW